MEYISLDGRILANNQPVIMATDRSYRYGDGLFETMKVVNGRIPLETYHFDRLFAGLRLLEFQVPAHVNAGRLKDDIFSLCEANGCSASARVRLSVSRGLGHLFDKPTNLRYLIECAPLSTTSAGMNKKGLIIDVYPDATKACDRFSHLKSANFLPYVMAARYALKNGLDDCLVLNTAGRIADTTIANVFMVKGNKVITPALTEGCVEGVMRRHLISGLEKLRAKTLVVEQSAITEEVLIQADEVFLTNAISGVKWVERFREKKYGKKTGSEIYEQLVQTIFL